MRRAWLVAALVAAVAAIVVAIVVVRVTGDESQGLSTNDWASSVCTSLAGWRDSITALADVSGGALTKESLEQKLDDAEAATAMLVQDLGELGPPALETGEDVERALNDATAGLEASFRALKQAAERAREADSPAEFLQALAGLADDYQRLLEQVEDTVATLQSASLFGDDSLELERAFADAEPCQELAAEG